MGQEVFDLAPAPLQEHQVSVFVASDDVNAKQTVMQLAEEIGFVAIDRLVATAVADENKKRGRFTDLDRATAHISFDKFWGYFHVTQATVPKMKPGGSITLRCKGSLRPVSRNVILLLLQGSIGDIA
jgi:enoyl-[acyl-carrier-protein] reductase (NADH)